MCNGYCGFDLCNGVCVMKKFVGLRSGKHAVHITEYGVHEESLVMELDGCKRETVTGDIWQPYKSAKKKPARGKEMGNLGNLIQPEWDENFGDEPADSHCRTVQSYECHKNLKFFGKKGIVDRSVVVYERGDDGTTGAESLEDLYETVGEPIACGTISTQKLSPATTLDFCYDQGIVGDESGA